MINKIFYEMARAKRLIVVSLLLFFSLSVYAQSPVRLKVAQPGVPSDSTSMAEAFAGYDFSDVPTGYLLEAGFPQIDLTQVNNVENAYIDFSTLHSIFESIKSADVSGVRDWSDNPFSEQSSADTHSLPLWISAYEFNSFSASAQSYVHYLNGHFQKVANAPTSSLYSSNFVVACAPGLMDISAGTVTFTCKLTENSNIDIVQMQLDAGDGLGYRMIEANQNVVVHYSESGLKELNLRVETASATFQSKSRIFVNNTRTLHPRFFIPSRQQIDSVEYMGGKVFAKISSWDCLQPGQGHRTLIIVEGYDPIQLQELLGEKDDYGFTSFSDIESEIGHNSLLQYFDIHYVDWLNCEADIRANAALLRNIINDINERKHQSGNYEGNVIIAQSMGGLITQYALRSMELAGESHETTHYFSHDVPYNGAIIPLGAIYAIQSLLDYLGHIGLIRIEPFKTKFLEVKEAVEMYMYSTSAQQMLINYINPAGEVDHTKFYALQQELSLMGLPKGDDGESLVNIAVSNGGPSTMLADSLATINNHLIDITASITPSDFIAQPPFYVSNLLLSAVTGLTGSDFLGGLLSVFPGLSHYDYSLEINPHTTSGQLLSSLQGVYTNRVLGIPFQRRFVDKKCYAPSVPALDLVNGSYYDLRANGFESTTDPMSEMNIFSMIIVGFLLNPEINLSVAPCFQFVPTYSSLRHSSGINTLDRDYVSSPLLYSDTNFASYFLPLQAEYHTTVFPWDRLLEQVNIHVDCPDTLHVGDILRLSDHSGDTTWDYNRNILNISQNTGRITGIYHEADVLVTGYYYSSGEFVSRKKRVHVVPNIPHQIYLEPHFNGDTLVLELHSPESELDARLQTWDVDRTWFYKWDLQPLVQYHHFPITFTINNFSQQTINYKLTVAAHVSDDSLGIHNQFVDYSIWNNQRIHLLQPTSIILSQNGVFMTSAVCSGYHSLLPEPLVVALDPQSNGDYTDALITPDVVFVNPDDLEFPCSLHNNYWALPNFFTNALNQQALVSVFNELSNDGDVGVFVIEMCSSSGGDPIQTFIIPILRKDNLAL